MDPNEGFKVNGARISNIRYANDTVIIAETEDDLQTMTDEIHQVSLLYGMKMNLKKTKVMELKTKKCAICNILLNGESIQQVHEFVYLGALITDDRFRNKEIKRRIYIYLFSSETQTEETAMHKRAKIGYQ